MHCLKDKYFAALLVKYSGRYPYVAGGVASQKWGIEFLIKPGNTVFISYREIDDILNFVYSVRFGFRDSTDKDKFWIAPGDFIDTERASLLHDGFHKLFLKKINDYNKKPLD